MKANFELDPVQWATLRQLLDSALALAPESRATWIDGLTAEHEAFKPRLRALLAHAAKASGASPLDTLPKVETAQFLAERAARDDDTALQAGASIGPYRLIRLLGEGGMGAVWLAERTDMLHKRQVALKLPRVLTGRARLAERLAREREILASLNHPNIARLYDAGITADGQPYLALEHVEGERIDSYCTRQQLAVPARLRLFLQIARALAHAHANLVVHRDLKPTNILVTESGEVRLLDFGIAKLLEEGQAQETELTRLAGRALTPEYASPEQILGQPIATSSDIYSLGVVLFELLTGQRPYKLKRDSRAALEEAIVQAEVQRPSSVAAEAKVKARLRGDLDTIVLKALKKDPAARYGTVEAFADDLERHLALRPVLAQPDSRRYRLGRFVARNKTSVALASVATLTVITGSLAISWQAHVATRERQRAEEVKQFIAGIFRDADPYQRSTEKLAVDELLRNAHQRVNRDLGERPEMRVELLELIGAGLKNMQVADAAEKALDEAVLAGESQLGKNHSLTLRARVTRLDLLRFQGRNEEIRSELRALLPQLRKAGANADDLVVALRTQAHNAIDEARYADAIAAAKEALDVALRSPIDRNSQAPSSATALALAYEYSHQPALAKAAAEQGLELATRARGGSRTDSKLIEARIVLARALGELGELRRCLDEMQRAVSESAMHFGATAIEVAFHSHNMAKYLTEAGEVKRALEATATAEKIFALHAKPGTYFYPYSRASHAIASMGARRRQDVVPVLQSASSDLAAVLGRAHPIYLRVQESLALAHAYRGETDQAIALLDELSAGGTRPATSASLRVRSIINRLSGRADAAVRLAREGLARISGARADSERMQVLPVLGAALVEIKADAEAVPAFKEALSLLTRLETVPSPERADVLLGLGRALMGAGAASEAFTHLQLADEFWRNFDPENRWAGEAAFWLGRCYEALDRKAEAQQSFARAAKILSGSPFPTDASLLQLAQRSGINARK